MSNSSKAVFLSYASQDAEAAKRICESLRTAGVEVWFDQSELVGGDAWDQKIRKQIKDCALLIPIISANTQARTEGYFRLEWRLADQRTHLMAKGRPFLLPVVIDDTRDADAQVPDSFTEVQWTRLPSGETPPKFAERVKKLLGGGSEVESGRTRPVNETRTEVAAPPKKSSRRWLIPTMLGGIVVAGALFWSQSRNLSGPAPATPSGQISETSGARWFVAQAWVQLNKPQLARAELEVAEGFSKRATEMDPNDAEAWSSSSQVDSWFVLHGLDTTVERREAARSKAAKALRLAPTNYEARLAHACYLVRGGGDLVAPSDARAADESLQSLLKERPDEPRALMALGTLQSNVGRAAEARTTYERMAANPDVAVVAWNEIGWADLVAGDYANAEVAAGRSVALQSYWGNLTLQALLAVWWRGDLDLAKSIFDRIPVAVRQEDDGVANICQLLFFRREPDALLRLLDGVPRDWLHSNAYDGPKALWAALAQEQLGRPERAQLQWQKALTQVERRLTQHPDADALLRLKAFVLAALGQGAEGNKIFQLARDSASAGSIQSFLRDVATQLRLGHPDVALDSLEHEPRLTAAACRIAPQLEVLSSHPRFQALLARLDSDPRASPKATKAIVTPVVDQKSVAVLAFANLSDDKGNEYFSDGISEELLNVLAKVPGLKVSARTSAFYFKGKEVPIPEIAQKLGVAYVVEGSVRKAGNQVRITAQLIKASDGFHVWSDTFTRDLKDIFAVQDEIAGVIAKSLELKLGAVRSTEVSGAEIEAYRLYWEARQAWNRRDPAGYDQAEALLTHALKLAPRFAKAHAALADVWAQRGEWDNSIGLFGDRDGPVIRRVLAKIDEALAIDPQSAEAHAARGNALSYAWQFAASEHAFRTAVALNPNFGTAHQWLGRALLAEGRLDEALVFLKRATELDPLSQRILDNYAWGLRHAGRHAEALVYLERALALQPDAIQAKSLQACALADLGRADEALAVIRSVPDTMLIGRSFRLFALGRLGRTAEIERMLPAIGENDLINRCLALALLGRTSEALSVLVPEKFTNEMDLLLFDPGYRSLREHSKWNEALAIAGLTEAQARAHESQNRLRTISQK